MHGQVVATIPGPPSLKRSVGSYIAIAGPYTDKVKVIWDGKQA